MEVGSKEFFAARLCPQSSGCLALSHSALFWIFDVKY